MQIKLYQIDAFTDRPFAGNPAAVCPLDDWPDDATLQAIAAENNLSETAFIVPNDEGYHLRWFTPAVEVPLCGHATLASGHVVLNHLRPGTDAVAFETLSGPLHVRRDGDRLKMDFPALPPEPVEPPPGLVESIGGAPVEILKANYYMLVYANEEEIEVLTPDFNSLGRLEGVNVMATAPGREVDFVSRFFAPAAGINEDPVTGSAHCMGAPYWVMKLDKSVLTARQISERGGDLVCELIDDRVHLTGACAFYMEGTITL